MRKRCFTIILCALSLLAQAQTSLVEKVSSLYQAQEFDVIISEYMDTAVNYPAKVLYYIGAAYHKKHDNENCMKFMELSIDKNNSDPEAHYIKATTHHYLGEFFEAIDGFKKAISLDDGKVPYFTGLGDAYFSLEKWERALAAYYQATVMPYTTDRPFIMIPQIFIAQNRMARALEASYEAKQIIRKETTSYHVLLHNIGLMEFEKRNYEKAEILYEELVELYPNDYNAQAKLLQVHYANKDIQKATNIKTMLSQAHREGLLPYNLKYMICLEQFFWKDKLVQVFERFDTPEDKQHYKHIFYVCNDNNNIEFQIQTEKIIPSYGSGEFKYVLGMHKEGAHTYFDSTFAQDVAYSVIKDAVLNILEERARPIASGL